MKSKNINKLINIFLSVAITGMLSVMFGATTVSAMIPGAITGNAYIVVNGTNVPLSGVRVTKQAHDAATGAAVDFIDWYETVGNGYYAVENNAIYFKGLGRMGYNGTPNVYGGHHPWGDPWSVENWCGDAWSGYGGWCGVNCGQNPQQLAAYFPPNYTGFPYGNNLSTGHWYLPKTGGTVAAGSHSWAYTIDAGNDSTATGYDFQWVPEKTVIKGRVVDTYSGAGIVGVAVTVCNNIGTAYTDGNGYYSFTLNYGQGFCLRPPTLTGYSGPYTNNASYPWNGTGSYECQAAGGLFTTCNNIDIGSDNNYDFNYTYQPPIDGVWGNWSACSASCKPGGTQTRYCNNPAPANGGLQCLLADGVTRGLQESRPCNTTIDCPVTPYPPTVINPTPPITSPQVTTFCINGSYTGSDLRISWTNPSSYPVNTAHISPSTGFSPDYSKAIAITNPLTALTTGPLGFTSGGTQLSMLPNTPYYARVQNSIGNSGYTQIGPFANCPIPGGWDHPEDPDGNPATPDWGTWGPCSASCGTGTQSKTRYCNSPIPQYNGTECVRGPEAPYFGSSTNSSDRTETVYQDCNPTPCSAFLKTTGGDVHVNQ